jgi:hypothetical protein
MQITLLGHPQPVAVQAGDTLLASLLRAGLPFPFSCQTRVPYRNPRERRDPAHRHR